MSLNDYHYDVSSMAEFAAKQEEVPGSQQIIDCNQSHIEAHDVFDWIHLLFKTNTTTT
jgi:hypothetical protein